MRERVRDGAIRRDVVAWQLIANKAGVSVCSPQLNSNWHGEYSGGAKRNNNLPRGRAVKNCETRQVPVNIMQPASVREGNDPLLPRQILARMQRFALFRKGLDVPTPYLSIGTVRYVRDREARWWVIPVSPQVNTRSF